MSHSASCNVVETHDLTPGCEACEGKRIADCDDALLKTVCGHTRRELEAEFGLFPDGTAGPYAAFWDAIINANATAVRARHHHVERSKRDVT